jgi:hypothetical protein
MRTSAAALLSAALLLAAQAHAGSLERLDHVDLIELDPKTSTGQLLIVLDEDRVNTRQSVKALYKKFNNYQDFIDSGQVLEAAPNISKERRPVVVVYAPKDATSGEMQNLAGLKLAASKVGAPVEIRPYAPGVKQRPIQIRPIKRAGGA